MPRSGTTVSDAAFAREIQLLPICATQQFPTETYWAGIELPRVIRTVEFVARKHRAGHVATSSNFPLPQTLPQPTRRLGL